MWDWAAEPLLLDFAGSLTVQAGLEFASKFRAMREADQRHGHSSSHRCPSLCIAACYLKGHIDLSPQASSSPEASVLPLVVQAARVTSAALLAMLESDVGDSEGQAVGEDVGAGGGPGQDLLAQKMQIPESVLRGDIVSKCNVLFRFRSSLQCEANELGVVTLSSAARGPPCASMRIFANLPTSTFTADSLLVR